MFGEFLVKNEIITPERLSEALGVQRVRARPIGRLLQELGHLNQDELNKQLHLYHVSENVRPLKELGSTLKKRLEAGQISQELARWAEEKGWLAYEESGCEVVFLAPWYRDDYLEKAEKQFGIASRLITVSAQGITLIRHLAGLEKPEHDSDDAASPSAERVVVGDNPYVALFRDIVEAAQREGASDIHILPQRHSVEVHLRVHGDLEPLKFLGVEHRQSFINEAKRLCGFSIAVSGEAQDGRISLPARKLDLRTSLLPAQYGEKIVMRLLDLTREFTLESNALPPATKNDLTNALRAKNGVVIVSGPTGSGKTTLLYTLLCSLDRKRKNIVTLEDPIEYTFDGLTQVEVTPKLSFGKALRSVLRQDPDVILVGEIRDQETADLCVKAASTGHLVLSTLHANSAAEVVSRLVNLGVDPYMLTACLRLSAAQRLVKKLCPHCSRQAPQSARGDLAALCLERNIRVAKDADLRVQNLAGCGATGCRKGVVGRLPVLEYLQAAGVKAHLGAASYSTPAPHYAKLRESALTLAEKGEADVCEVLELE